ncbi:MAG: TRAP transporter substrate-binding protein DctP, partial [Allosphingosinicella sp.]
MKASLSNSVAASEEDELSEETIQLRVGHKIRELRQASGMKAVDLAVRAGLSSSQLSKIETGKATLSIKTLARLCEVFDRPLSYLFQSDREVPRTFGVVGTLTTVEGPEAQGMRAFLNEVAQSSGDRLSFIPLRAPQLGSGADQVRQLRDGLIDMFIEDLALFQEEAPALRVLSMPYAFSDQAHRQRFLESEHFQDAVVRPLRQAGIRLLNRSWNWRRGIEWVLASNRPVFDVASVKGLRVRVRDQTAQIAFWNGLGAVSIVVPWTEVRSALARDEIDAVATNKSHLYPLGFSKYARYVTLLGDLSPVLAVAVNDAKFQALPPDLQQCLVDSCERAGDVFTATVEEAERVNEPANIAEHKAVYMRVPMDLWKAHTKDLCRRLVAHGVMPA